MFWIWALWPRRKTCAKWMDNAQYMLENEICNELIVGRFYSDKQMLDEEVAEMLEMEVRDTIKDVCGKMKKLISKPLYD